MALTHTHRRTVKIFISLYFHQAKETVTFLDTPVLERHNRRSINLLKACWDSFASCMALLEGHHGIPH